MGTFGTFEGAVGSVVRPLRKDDRALLKRKKRPLVLGAFFSLLVAAGAPAILVAEPSSPLLDPAKKAEALKHFKAGLEHWNNGEYADAIKKYRTAYRIYPSPKILVNIGACYRYMNRFVRSIEYYEKFLSVTTKDSSDPTIQRLRRESKREIRFMMQQVGRLRLVVGVPGADVKVAGLSAGQAPMDKILRFMPGRINIIVKKKGYYSFDRTVRLKAGQLSTVKVLLLRAIERKVVLKIKRATPTWKKWWFWTALGSVAAGAVAAALGYRFGRKTEETVLSGYPVQHRSLPTRW